MKIIRAAAFLLASALIITYSPTANRLFLFIPEASEILTSYRTHTDTSVAAETAATASTAFAEYAGIESPDLYYYYASILSDEEQSIYDALLSCVNSGNPTKVSDRITISMNPSSETFSEAFRRAYNALVYEHPELFWLTVDDTAFEFTYRSKLFQQNSYSIAFRLSDVPDDREEMLAQFTASADSILEQVDLTQSDPLIALQIHDLLIDLVTYNYDVTADGTANLAHTAYGALVTDSAGNANSAVCDGYTLAYEYLLQRVNIPCVMVAGHAGDSSETAGTHSWNLVQLDGEWYEVDVTWDDITFHYSEDESYSSIMEQALADEEYVDRLHHFMFNLTTEQISVFQPGDEYRYETYNGWVTFLNDSVHMRYTAEESSLTGDYLSSLAPIAAGTTWTYQALANE